MTGTRLLLAALLWALAGGAALAQESKKAPYLEIAIPIEIQTDWTARSDDPGSELVDLFTTIEPEMTVGIYRGLSLFVHAVFEPLRDPGFREDRAFESHGLLLEDLYLQYKGALREAGPVKLGFRVWGGKFTPGFGIAWDEAPGLYGADFAEDGYELVERIGFGGALRFGHHEYGTHTLSASTFFLDTSALSGAIITRRPRTRLADGGPSNTESFSSFHVALDGEGLPLGTGLRYHLAFVHQAVRGGANEDAIAAALLHGFKVGGVTITALVEFVHFWDADGEAGQRRRFLTTAAKAEYKGWSLAVSHTLRDTLPPGGARVRDGLFQLSGGYTFKNGIGIEIGWSHRNEDSTSSDTFGILLTYEFTYEVGGK